jgi:hypothetical protein
MKKIFKLLCLVPAMSSVCYGMDYEVEIQLKDGTSEHYAGNTADGKMPDYDFGHDPADIVQKDWTITSTFDNN